MFQHSSNRPIDKELTSLAEDIESRSPGVKVLAARQFHYSVCQQPLQLHITEPRKINVLEEFILRAASELVPPPRPEELAAAMGLAPVFVNSTLDFLRVNNAIESPVNAPIKLTDTGRSLHQQGIMPQEIVKKEAYLIRDPFLENLVLKDTGLTDPSQTLPSLDEYLSIGSQKKTKPSLKNVQALANTMPSRHHDPAEGREVTGYEITGNEKKVAQIASAVLMYDFLEDKEKLQIRKGSKVVESATVLFQDKFVREELPIDEMFGIERSQFEEFELPPDADPEIETYDDEVKQLNERIEALKREILTLQRDQEPSETKAVAHPIEIIRDDKIRDVFINTVKQAKKQVIICSPWITDEVVDSKFIDMLQALVNAGVWVVIGHGIAMQKERETKPLSPSLETKLKNIKSPNSVQGVHVVWLGNIHYKEVIVDRQVFLHGSYNYLSYRGDRYPRGESVSKITFPETINNSYSYHETKFSSHADRMWQKYLSTHNDLLAHEAISIWCALDKEHFALEQIQKNSEWTLLPFWLTSCSHIKIHSDETRLATLLEGAANLMDIGSHQQQAHELRTAWDLAIDRLMSVNRELGMSLLKDEVWPRLELLGCVGPEEKVDDFLAHSEIKTSLQQLQQKHNNSNGSKKKKKK